MNLNTKDFQKAINLCKNTLSIEDPRESPFLPIAFYRAISIRQIEKRLVEINSVLSGAEKIPPANFREEDIELAIKACRDQLAIEIEGDQYKEHPYLIAAMYEAMSFRQVEEKMKELTIQASKVRRELTDLQKRTTALENRMSRVEEEVRTHGHGFNN